MTKLEEVARAIYERRSRRTGYVWPGDVYPAFRNRCLSDARAAIEALREPSDGATAIFMQHKIDHELSEDGNRIMGKAILAAWIDAILSEGE